MTHPLRPTTAPPLPRFDFPNRHRSSSFLFSLLFHTILLLVLVIAGWNTATIAPAPDRSVEIVLVAAAQLEQPAVLTAEPDFELNLKPNFESDLESDFESDFESNVNRTASPAAESNLDPSRTRPINPLVDSSHSAGQDLPPMLLAQPPDSTSDRTRLSSSLSNFPSIDLGPLDANRSLDGPPLRYSGRPQPGDGTAAGLAAERLAAEQAIVESRKPIGEPVALDFLGISGMTGRSFVFLIDRSGSMGGDGLGLLEATRNELKSAIANLGDEHRFQVLFYNDRVNMLFRQSLLPATAANQQRIDAYLNEMVAFGGTNHLGGLYSALSLNPDVIIMMGDGGDPHLSAGQLATIKRTNQGRSQIHCIEFGEPQATPPGQDSFMWQLAAQNGGSYRYFTIGITRTGEKILNLIDQIK